MEDESEEGFRRRARATLSLSNGTAACCRSPATQAEGQSQHPNHNDHSRTMVVAQLGRPLAVTEATLPEHTFGAFG